MKRLVLAGIVVLALIAAACGGGDGPSGEGVSMGGHDSMGDHGGAMVVGEPADPSEADREIEVASLDALKFDPASIEVFEGEVVTFVIRNDGKADHEFVLGDEPYQQQHGEGMPHDSGSMMDMGNAVTVRPGETAELTWRFDETGDVSTDATNRGTTKAA